jgi:hypothetical protein
MYFSCNRAIIQALHGDTLPEQAPAGHHQALQSSNLPWDRKTGRQQAGSK